MRTDADFSLSFRHRLRFTRGVFEPANATLRECVPTDGNAPARCVIFIDSGVLETHPHIGQQARTYCDANDDRICLAGRPHRVIGGEGCKNDPQVVEDILAVIHDSGLCRRSYVLAVGGGAVLDVVGYAAAIAHRGVRLIRVPSTTLGQGDSGVGVKNGVNRFGKKNYIGTFAVPHAVINDEALLTTLSDNDWIGGFSEAVKVSLLKDPDLFGRLELSAEAIRNRETERALPLLRRSAHLHMDHIVNGGDPFELNEARPLDFGHWAAHKIEQMSDFDVSHGDAVAIGLRIDVLYSELAGLIDRDEAVRIGRCLDALGLPTWHECLDDVDALANGLEEFREHLGGRLTITLLRGIGDPIDVHRIRSRWIGEAIGRLRAGEAARSGRV